MGTDDGPAEPRNDKGSGLPGEVRITAQRLNMAGETPTDHQAVRCPTCATAEKLTLVARHRDAHVECPNGHQWHEPHFTATVVRTLMHRVNAGQDTPQIPVGQPAMMLPVLDEPTDLAAGPSSDSEDDDSPLSALISERASAEFAADLANHDCAARACFRTARQMSCLALPADGDLYSRLYPSAGGSAVDAHMSVVVLALALYEAVIATSRGAGAALFAVPFETVAEQLSPGSAVELRACRPRLMHSRFYFLRSHDLGRLEAASKSDFERWRRAADDVLAFTASVAAQSSMWQRWKEQDRDCPFDLRFADSVVPTFPDDYVWYWSEPT